MLIPTRPFNPIRSPPFPAKPNHHNRMPCHSSSSSTTSSLTSTSPSHSPPIGTQSEEELLSLREWQAWGTASPVPTMVAQVIKNMKALERDSDSPMTFGGVGGKLQGEFKNREDKKHRAVYQSLTDPESKLQFFSARQIACRLLGSRGYLCQKCWLAMEDCMCSKMASCSLWHKIRFWLYMHPKDFLRQNNTGKLLWQIFGLQAATLCLFGIDEHEEIMWDAFKLAGKDMVWFLYPNKNTNSYSIQDICLPKLSRTLDGQSATEHEQNPLNFVLIDGTWSNSSAMFHRLKEHAKKIWGDDDLPCITLSGTGASAMHKLRPQPSWDRTCTAAAAASLLSELHLRPELGLYGLDEQAVAVEDALEVLLDALTNRRLRMGRSITRREKDHFM
ncbi:hypothetical protein QJS10_CPB20g01855 [Acorus calamus]|uniref:tRNA-uridine aminocarboxypropyltransferase n=1 Tax=Acorus calamus TaxID=4465 RepID=A0AAV9CAW0_ACOCL|nr:hypothetical protein QJS10_CPB20g01855 [Acorus calamus]